MSTLSHAVLVVRRVVLFVLMLPAAGPAEAGLSAAGVRTHGRRQQVQNKQWGQYIRHPASCSYSLALCSSSTSGQHTSAKCRSGTLTSTTGSQSSINIIKRSGTMGGIAGCAIAGTFLDARYMRMLCNCYFPCYSTTGPLTRCSS
jgi:hypothetical protein